MVRYRDYPGSLSLPDRSWTSHLEMIDAPPDDDLILPDRIWLIYRQGKIQVKRRERERESSSRGGGTGIALHAIAKMKTGNILLHFRRAIHMHGAMLAPVRFPFEQVF